MFTAHKMHQVVDKLVDFHFVVVMFAKKFAILKTSVLQLKKNWWKKVAVNDAWNLEKDASIDVKLIVIRENLVLIHHVKQKWDIIVNADIVLYWLYANL